MAKAKTTTWHEKEFEQWFKSKPQLLGQPLLLVNSQSAIKRMVDLIALDRQGRLVIIEVKNEPTTREAIGQALEYLSTYQKVSLDDLADEYELEEGKGDLRAEFKKRFGRPLHRIATGRRVYVVAPAHDPYSAVCAGYLSDHLSEGIQFQLLTARLESAGWFDVQPYDCPPITKGADLKEGFALSLRGGRLFYVIEPGSPPHVWNIGRWNATEGTLRSVFKSSHTLLRPCRSYLAPLAVPAQQVDRSSMGSVWRRVGKPGRKAFVIGRVTLRKSNRKDASYFAFAEFRNGRFKRFRCRVAQKFLDQWKKTDAPRPPWHDIVRLARTT